MAFWGIKLEPGSPFTHSCDKSNGRLRISQATLGVTDATFKSVVQCNLGKRSPVALCVLLPNKTESCPLDLEFEETDDVVFSVLGPQTVYLTGYYLQKYQQSNPNSDTESYGVDIEHTKTEGSSYCSDDDKYEDSFIDDIELPVSCPPFVLNNKASDDTMLESDMPLDKIGHDKQLRQGNKVIDSNSDAIHENGDGYLLSTSKSGKAKETTLSDDEHYIANLLVEMGERANGVDFGSELKEKLDSGIFCIPEREAKMMPLDDKLTQIENKNDAFPEEVQTLETDVNHDNSLIGDEVDGNDEATKFGQILPVNNGKGLSQIADQNSTKSKRKRKKVSKREKKACKVLEIDGEHDVSKAYHTQEIDASTNMDVDIRFLLEDGSENSRNSKKRRKELLLKDVCTGEIGRRCHDIAKDDEYKQGLPCADNTSIDLLAANEEHHEQQIDSHRRKKIHKKTKKKIQCETNLDKGVPNMNDNLENSVMKFDLDGQTEKDMHIKRWTLSNELIIEEIASGPADGKIAVVGKKIKVYYTGMLKENGHIFDTNVDGTACSCRLGDEEFIDGWNIGIEGMCVGDKRRLIIPPSLGFGNLAMGENVPPNSWLVYEIELIKVRG